MVKINAMNHMNARNRFADSWKNNKVISIDIDIIKEIKNFFNLGK